MKRLYYAALTYMILGLAAGLFYREFTKSNDYTGDTQLAVTHTHVLALGMLMFLIVLTLDKQFALSKSKLFSWFFWLYNAGLFTTVAMLTANGINEVRDTAETSRPPPGTGSIAVR